MFQMSIQSCKFNQESRNVTPVASRFDSHGTEIFESASFQNQRVSRADKDPGRRLRLKFALEGGLSTK
jgi:hypothetical protein